MPEVIGIDKPAPHSERDERMVLSAILRDPSRFDEAAQYVRASHFYRDAYQKVFAAFETLVSEGREVHLEGVVDYLASRKELANVVSVRSRHALRAEVRSGFSHS
ncbi:MAG TPA: DnaB-like helicase N-terminal domain-containing protein [Urbifossiella sp.]|nr:DnaB-like helicase N-terminal domain-containing protein [Urbifossiella sp.]